MIFVQNNKQPIFTENGEKQQAAKLFSKWPPADAESKGLSAKTGVASAMIRGFFRLKHSMSSCLVLHFFSWEKHNVSKELYNNTDTVWHLSGRKIKRLSRINNPHPPTPRKEEKKRFWVFFVQKSCCGCRNCIRLCYSLCLCPQFDSFQLVTKEGRQESSRDDPGVSKVYSQSRAREP